MAIRHFRCDTEGVLPYAAILLLCHATASLHRASLFREDKIQLWSSEVLSMQFMNLNILFGD